MTGDVSGDERPNVPAERTRPATTKAASWLAPVVGCLLLAGCGSGNDRAAVRGKVTLNGRPLADAIVQFQPVAPNGSPSAAKTDAQGRYELMSTFSTPGAIPDEHLVTIRSAATYYDEEDCGAEQRERIPAKYNAQSELRRTVKPGRNTIDFDL